MAVAAPQTLLLTAPRVVSPSSHKTLSHDWGNLSTKDRRQLGLSAWHSRYILNGDVNHSGESCAWQPAGPVPPPSSVAVLHVDPPAEMKRSHLHGNAGVVTNPQPALTDKVKSFLVKVDAPVPTSPRIQGGENQSSRDRKVFELSSDLFESERLLFASTHAPKRELFDACYASFPYGDSSLDQHVTKGPGTVCVDSPTSTLRSPMSTLRSPRIRFEPPARPGASFRRRTEKNFSDMFDSEPPPAATAGPKRMLCTDMNQLSSGFFQDMKTEVARRNGELRRPPPRRLRSEPNLCISHRSSPRPACVVTTEETPNAAAGTDPRQAPAAARKTTHFCPAAGLAGSGGGEAHALAAASEEAFAAEAAEIPANALWQQASSNAPCRGWRVSADGQEPGETLQFASDSQQRYGDDMSSRAFGGAAVIRVAGASPTRLGATPPLFSHRSPRSPRSPRAVSNGDDRGGSLDDDLEGMLCKAAARERFRRHMSSDSASLFGTER